MLVSTRAPSKTVGDFTQEKNEFILCILLFMLVLLNVVAVVVVVVVVVYHLSDIITLGCLRFG